MSGECRGWSSWDRFKEAGVVDEHIDFSDNKVVVDNVLGRTRDTIRECFAIDAAVSYTLSKAGPDANLTVQDMVNEYTRTAAAIPHPVMSRYCVTASGNSHNHVALGM